MGLLDKAKEAAASAMAQGQAKVGAYQQGRNETELYRALGEAFYREQRQGGDRDAVMGALSALDSHFAQVAAAAAAAPSANASAAETSTAETSTAETSTAGTPTADQPATPPPPAAGAPTGNFTLDDL